MRFSLRWLFGVTLFAAMSCACLIYATQSVQGWLGLALNLFLLLSILGAFYAPREQRAFWGGCALVGCYYLASDRLPSEIQQPRNAVSRALWRIHEKIVRDVPIEDFPAYYTGDPAVGPPKTVQSPHIGDFLDVGHTLATFLVAFIGGAIALWFDRRASRKSAGPATASLS
ncbi:MAG TPA: hypothetical protein VHC22_14210 [Pirellulales bacterium]|nr:hypothetical protein [Pirellulales bacterium]